MKTSFKSLLAECDNSKNLMFFGIDLAKHIDKLPALVLELSKKYEKFSGAVLAAGITKDSPIMANDFIKNAKELEPKVRINCISPGYTDTPLINKNEAKKLLNPSDIAELALFLLSQNASKITGQNYKISAEIL